MVSEPILRSEHESFLFEQLLQYTGAQSFAIKVVEHIGHNEFNLYSY